MQRNARPFAVLVAVAAMVLGVLGGIAPAAIGAPVAPAAAPSTSSATRTIRLITGDTIRVHTVGALTTATPIGESAGSFTTVLLGTHRYVFPRAAHYYMPGVLDPALFDVTSSTASTPVDVTFSGARPVVPGLTVTSSTATSLHGYVSAAGATAFGAALRAQFQRDVRAGATPTTLFGASRIALATTPVIHPDFPQVTLILDATAHDGTKLKNGFIGLINTDDPRKYGGFLAIRNGEARASVPLGNYSLIGEEDVFTDTDDNFTLKTWVSTISDFAVATNLQREAVDFTKATVKPSIQTPQPATLDQLGIEWARLIGDGGLIYSFAFGPQDSVRVAPAPAPVHGTLDWATSWALSGKGSSGPVRYDAAYDEPSISADQHKVFDPAKAGRVDASFYTDGQSKMPTYGRTPIRPFDFFVFLESTSLSTPTVETQYAIAPSTVFWVDLYDDYAEDSAQETFLIDEPRVYPPGSQQRIDWLRGPLAPGTPGPTAQSQFFFCPGCRTAGQLGLSLAPITDTTESHAAYTFGEDSTASKLTLYRDGKQIAANPDGTDLLVNAPRTAATYRAVVETDLSQLGYRHSTHAVTELTFNSSATGGVPVPANWYCPLHGDCQVLPLLRATVPLPTDLRGVVPQGKSSFVFTIGGVDGGPAISASTASLAISVAGGAERTVAVTPLGAGRFRATITHPAADAGKLVTIKVAGRDGQGDTITETVTDAYAVASR